MRQPTVSIVLPVYRCAHYLERLVSRVEDTLKPEKYSYELIFVDDRGEDADWLILKELARTNKNIRAFRHRHNAGQFAAIATGVHQAKGDYIVVMDADLQDPPEEIPRFIQFAKNGKYDIVLSVRSERQSSAFRKTASTIYRKFFPVYSRIPNGNYYGMYSAFSRKIVPSYLAATPANRYAYIKVLEQLSKNIGFIYYAQDNRSESRSSYSLKKLITVSANGIGKEFWIKLTKTSVLMSLLVLLGGANQLASTHVVNLALLFILIPSILLAAFSIYALRLTRKTIPESFVEIVDSLNASAQPFKSKVRV